MPNTPPLQEIIQEPLGDDDIRYYFPEARILKYNQLVQYPTIEDLLPENQDFCFLLYEDSPNKGHWVLILRNNDQIEYFDSYGGKVDSPLEWTPCSTRHQLGQTVPYLSNLLNKSPFEVVYNPIAYQEDKQDINTCGRHAVARVCSRFGPDNMDLPNYYKLLRFWKKQTEASYDTIISALVDRV